VPPTFLYFIALVLYVGLACAVWGWAILIALIPRKRAFAKRLAAGMAGSFPGVFICQILSAPLIALWLLIAYGITGFFSPPPLLAVLLVLPVFGIAALASLIGFYLGWNVAWELAAGRSAWAFLKTRPVIGPVFRLLHGNSRL
jgi:hypothetical protein